jgi:hypothetical protein
MKGALLLKILQAAQIMVFMFCIFEHLHLSVTNAQQDDK